MVPTRPAQAKAKAAGSGPQSWALKAGIATGTTSRLELARRRPVDCRTVAIGSVKPAARRGSTPQLPAERKDLWPQAVCARPAQPVADGMRALLLASAPASTANACIIQFHPVR